jgi:hypothetical protein
MPADVETLVVHWHRDRTRSRTEHRPPGAGSRILEPDRITGVDHQAQHLLEGLLRPGGDEDLFGAAAGATRRDDVLGDGATKPGVPGGISALQQPRARPRLCPADETRPEGRGEQVERGEARPERTGRRAKTGRAGAEHGQRLRRPREPRRSRGPGVAQGRRGEPLLWELRSNPDARAGRGDEVPLGLERLQRLEHGRPGPPSSAASVREDGNLAPASPHRRGCATAAPGRSARSGADVFRSPSAAGWQACDSGPGQSSSSAWYRIPGLAPAGHGALFRRRASPVHTSPGPRHEPVSLFERAFIESQEGRLRVLGQFEDLDRPSASSGSAASRTWRAARGAH